MAINIEIIKSNSLGALPGIIVPVQEEPSASFDNVVAAGATTIGTGGVFTVRNRSGGDSVYCLVKLASATGLQASASNARLLAAGDEFSFTLPRNASSSYAIDIRA